MHPILWQGPWGLTLYSFGALVLLGLLSGTALAWVRAGRWALPRWQVLDWGLLSGLAGLAGAKVMHWVFFPQAFLQDPLGSLLANGGLVWYGGLLGGALMAFWLSRFATFSFWALADVYALPVLLGLALGRVGCFLAGCCFGGACPLPWAVRYPAGHATGGALVHPAPLYESLGALVLLGLLAWLERRYQWQLAPVGRTAAAFFMGYGLLRFVLESLRGDRLIWLQGLNLSASQVISLGLVLGGALLFWDRLRRKEQRRQSL